MLNMFRKTTRLPVLHWSEGFNLHETFRRICLHATPEIRIGNSLSVIRSFNEQCLIFRVGGPPLFVGDSDLLGLLRGSVSAKENKFLADFKSWISEIRVVPQHQRSGRQQIGIVGPIGLLGEDSNTSPEDGESPRCKFNRPQIFVCNPVMHSHSAPLLVQSDSDLLPHTRLWLHRLIETNRVFAL